MKAPGGNGADRPRATAAEFEPVSRSERLADKVANSLLESIVSGRIAIGERLPSERELCERFGVSRPVVREAVRSLIAKGLLSGHAHRGHVVTAFGRDAVTESLTFYLRGRRLDYTKLMEVRMLIETENAGLAAERASPEQAEAVLAAASHLRASEDVQEAVLDDIAFHRAVATATDNEFLEILQDSLREALITVQLPTLADPKAVASARRAHERIAAQIAGQDPQGAREAMRKHLQEGSRGMETLTQATAAASATDSPRRPARRTLIATGRTGAV
jgi:GntR family transcriptional repressor for pyruvate dehydrogenase complex